MAVENVFPCQLSMFNYGIAMAKHDSVTVGQLIESLGDCTLQAFCNPCKAF